MSTNMTLNGAQLLLHDSGVSRAFGKKANTYNSFALVQRFAAARLIKKFPELSESISILEVGCGTGFITQKLLQKYPNSSMLITDISGEMIEACQKATGELSNQSDLVEFRKMDAESTSFENKYDLIVSGMAAQWFSEFEQTIIRLQKALKPNGSFMLSFLTDDTFPEWKEQCKKTGVICTANRMPSPDFFPLLDGCIAETIEPFSFELRFSKSVDFFKSLKSIGASSQKDGLSLTISDFRKLTTSWDKRESGHISATYKGQIAVIKRTDA